MSFLGSMLDITDPGRIMLLDIGGGSTEIAAGTGDRVDYARSLKMGCVRLTERFFHSDPVKPSQIGEAAGFIDGMLQANVNPDRLGAVEKTVAVAGTVTSLAAIDLNLSHYDRDAVNGHILGREKLEGLFNRLAGMNIEQKLRIDTIEAGRADVIVAGALIALRVMEYTSITEFTVSEHDILDGAAVEMASLYN